MVKNAAMSKRRSVLRTPRPEWQRQIIRWYFAYRHTLPVRLVLRQPGEKEIRFDFRHAGSPLRVHFCKRQMCVAAYHQGKLWDVLLWAEYLDDEYLSLSDADCARAQCVALQSWIQQACMHPVCLRFESSNSGGMTMARLEQATPLELDEKSGSSPRKICVASYCFYSNCGA